MKLLQINTVCGIKSTGRITVDIAELMTLKGDDTRIIYGTEELSAIAEKYAFKIGSKWENRIHSAVSKFFDYQGSMSHCATAKAIKFIKQYKPDVIHLHNIHGSYINYKMLFAFLKKYNKPVIWTLHDCWSFTGHCAYFDMVSCSRWQKSCGNCPQIHSYPESYFFDFTKRNIKRKMKAFTGVKNLTLVSPSQWLADLTKSSYLKEYDCKVFPNGIDTKQFRPIESNELRRNYDSQYKTLSKKIVLAVASDRHEEKGLKYMLELAERLKDEIVMVIVGLDQEKIKELSKNVLGVKKTYNLEELVKWYSTADLFINPTLEDNMPLVTLEALACGTPAVVFNTGGTGECICDKVGSVAKRGSIEELESKVRVWLNKKNSVTKACREQAEVYSKTICFKRYTDLYSEVNNK